MFDFQALLPEGIELLPHQTTGVATGLIERRLIFGDEMGVGKTPEALVTLEAADAYPAIVICPASLKAQWASEINKFLPHRGIFIASGRPSALTCDITIISYSLLSAWLHNITNVQTAIFDESHYVSNPRANRSRASIALGQRIPEDGLVMGLTGTVFLNKPEEIISQLQLIGRLHDFAPEPATPNDERAWAKSFREHWCKDTASLLELHRALCQSCYVRRQRVDVIGRAETQRNVVKLSLGAALSEYREAEQDLVSYLTERDGAEAAAKSINSEGLVRVNKLRQLVGEAKVWAAQEWIDNFIESNPERSLVVFAYHKDIQDKLVEHYKCPHILGGEKDVEKQKRLFQQGASPIIVVSLTAGREGHSLTTAADVLFVELGWTPGGMSQAECRINRIGQEEAQTYAWYLHGANTIDERIWAIVERKRVLFAAGAEGKVLGSTDSEYATAREVLETYYQREPHTAAPRQIRKLRIVR